MAFGEGERAERDVDKLYLVMVPVTGDERFSLALSTFNHSERS